MPTTSTKRRDISAIDRIELTWSAQAVATSGNSTGRPCGFQAPIVSSGQWHIENGPAKDAEDYTGEVSLESADRLAPGLALLALALNIGTAGGVVNGRGAGDGMECSIELAIATPVESHPVGLPRTCGNWGGAGEHGK